MFGLLLKLLERRVNTTLSFADHHSLVLRKNFVFKIESHRLSLSELDLPFLIVNFEEIADD